jgi:hypothetical protein
MKVLGLRCHKDKLDWAFVEGDTRDVAVVVESKSVSAPDVERGPQLAWVRNEILELLDHVQPDRVQLRGVEPGGQGNSLPRAEVEGVVQEAVASREVPVKRIVSASLRSAFGVKNGKELDAAAMQVTAISTTAKVRRDPVIAAVAALASRPS